MCHGLSAAAIKLVAWEEEVSGERKRQQQIQRQHASPLTLRGLASFRQEWVA